MSTVCMDNAKISRAVSCSHHPCADKELLLIALPEASCLPRRWDYIFMAVFGKGVKFNLVVLPYLYPRMVSQGQTKMPVQHWGKED